MLQQNREILPINNAIAVEILGLDTADAPPCIQEQDKITRSDDSITIQIAENAQIVGFDAQKPRYKDGAGCAHDFHRKRLPAGSREREGAGGGSAARKRDGGEVGGGMRW